MSAVVTCDRCGAELPPGVRIGLVYAYTIDQHEGDPEPLPDLLGRDYCPECLDDIVKVCMARIQRQLQEENAPENPVCAGWTAKDIARECSCHEQTVYIYLRKEAQRGKNE